MMLRCIQLAYQGVLASFLRREVERPCWNKPEEQVKEGCVCMADSGECKVHGFGWARALGFLRRRPPYVQKDPSHTWRLHEENGRLKLYDIRRLATS